MRHAVIALALLAASPAAAQSTCTKPDVPACALERVPFANDMSADECRKAMLGFRDTMSFYALCVGKTSRDEQKAAHDEYEDVLARFNRRARGATD